MNTELLISFFIEGFKDAPERVTELLKVNPTETHIKGEIKKNTILKWKTNIWILRSEKRYYPKLDEPIKELLLKLPNDLNSISSLEGEWHSEFTCVAYLDSNELVPEMYISRSLVENIANLHASIGFDVYIL